MPDTATGCPVLARCKERILDGQSIFEAYHLDADHAVDVVVGVSMLAVHRLRSYKRKDDGSGRWIKTGLPELQRVQKVGRTLIGPLQWLFDAATDDDDKQPIFKRYDTYPTSCVGLPYQIIQKQLDAPAKPKLTIADAEDLKGVVIPEGRRAKDDFERPPKTHRFGPIRGAAKECWYRVSIALDGKEKPVAKEARALSKLDETDGRIIVRCLTPHKKTRGQAFIVFFKSEEDCEAAKRLDYPA